MENNSSELFTKNFTDERRVVEDYLHQYLEQAFEGMPAKSQIIRDACAYSLFSGGKRFRPALVMTTAHALGIGPDRVLPWATAIEFIHTYSLIHDDLPALDNDDFRRGRPSNHRQFGEDVALLAGDALLTEAFHLLAKRYRDLPDVCVGLVELLGECSGVRGMVTGQVLDVKTQLQKDTALNAAATEELLTVHDLKTGALIRASVAGVGIVGRLNTRELNDLNNFGKRLGLAFQVADDLQDYFEKPTEITNLVRTQGLDATRALLRNLSDEAQMFAERLGRQSHRLVQIVDFNRNRAPGVLSN